jgi:ERCC4-type nuclease
MSLLISPTEPDEIKALGKTSSTPERYGVDIFWAAKRRKFGIQRKQFPADFLSSVYDNRLSKELHQMAALDHVVLIIEGFGQWTVDGHLMDDRRQFHRDQFYPLLMTMALEFNVPTMRVRNLDETVAAILSIQRWSKKTKHTSLLRRPGPTSPWGKVTNRDWGIHLLQSFEGIGPEVAGAIYDHFGGAPLEWSVGETDLQGVKGVGKGRAQKLIQALKRK